MTLAPEVAAQRPIVKVGAHRLRAERRYDPHLHAYRPGYVCQLCGLHFLAKHEAILVPCLNWRHPFELSMNSPDAYRRDVELAR